jgi:hypothetical protein
MTKNQTLSAAVIGALLAAPLVAKPVGHVVDKLKEEKRQYTIRKQKAEYMTSFNAALAVARDENKPDKERINAIVFLSGWAPIEKSQ